ncbi:MAG: CRISPR-associated protein Cas4 [Candidatus Abyssubacteria bacterium]
MAFVPDDTEWVMISALEHYAYCPRQCALIHIEQIWNENLFTAEGRIMHDKADLEGTTEARGDVRIARGLRLHSRRLGLTGKADVVEFHRVRDEAASSDGAPPPAVALPGVAGLWTPFPVEYKRGHLRHEEGFEIQLCAQALCLEEMMNVRVPAGALFYGKTARRLDIAFDSALREKTETAVARLHALFREGRTPTATYEKKCDKCSLLSLCMPKATGSRKNIRRYLENVVNQCNP